MDTGPASDLWDLSVRYAIGADERDEATFLSVFSDDAELIVRGPPGIDRDDRVITGADQLARIPQRLARYERTFHMLGQSQYHIDGERASGTVYCQAHHFSTDTDGGHDFVMYIRYQDVYTAVGEGRWRIRSRDVRVEWTESRRTDG